MSQVKENVKKVTTTFLQSKKKRDKKITALTAYDATFARLLDVTGIDVILVGDSLGTVIQGHDNTIPVTVDDIIYHTKAVKRGSKRAHIVADMPFTSYQSSIPDAIRSSGRVVKESGAEAVKLEGGMEMVETVRALTNVGIPVMAHIGLKPQFIHQMGGYKIQGKTALQAKKLLEEAEMMQEAGAYSVLLEGVAIETAKKITETLEVPTIGIGSGPYCDGQILVIYDLLGMDSNFTPRFLKRYSNLSEQITTSVSKYIKDIYSLSFPKEEHGFNRDT